MHVAIPSALRSYTAGAATVEACGTTVQELLGDLETRFPGIRFRMVNEIDALRPHIRIFVNRQQVDDLCQTLSSADEVVILQALSGG